MAHVKNYDTSNDKKFYKKKWFKIILFFVIFLVIVFGAIAWKTGGVLSRISSGNLLGSVIRSIPGVDNILKGEDEDRINIALLGMRGENIPGGGLLADTIIVASLKPSEGKVSMISVPRDLQITVPGTQTLQKINYVYFAGEEKGKGQGLEDMQTILSDVLGIPVDYAVSINFAGFEQLIDAVGGIEITLDQSFEEPAQFNEARVCDGDKGGAFTIPTGKFEKKIDYRGKEVAKYPLCTNPDVECGGNFKLPAGTQILNGENALCYVRSRATTTDFERAKRQQIVLKLLREKLLSAGTLTDFGKLNGILDSLGNNVRSTLAAWEMKRFFEIYGEMPDFQVYQRVLENSPEGLLYNPTNAPKEYGYILRPIGDNYDKIHEMARDIFILPAQSDIKPK